MNDAISPFIIKRPNRCLNCDNPLVLVTTEVTIMEIDDNGHPLSTEDGASSKYTNVLCCPICQSKYHVWIDETNMVIRPAFGDTNILIRDRSYHDIDDSPFNSKSEEGNEK